MSSTSSLQSTASSVDITMENYGVRTATSATLLQECEDTVDETFSFGRPRTSSMKTTRDLAALARRRGSKEMIWRHSDTDCMTTKVVSPLHLARTLGYVEGIWSRYLAYCIVYVHVYIFANVKESEQCHKNAKRTAVVAKCFAKGKFVLLDSVLTSIHNKNLLSIKQKTNNTLPWF